MAALARQLIWCLIGFAAARIWWGLRQRRNIRSSTYQAYELSAEAHDLVLRKFPPRYANVRADHITYAYGVEAECVLPPRVNCVQAVGYSNDGSLEALVVNVDGTTTRPDGNTYHITLSYEPGRRSFESNRVIAEHGWQAIEALELTVEPAYQDGALKRIEAKQ